MTPAGPNREKSIWRGGAPIVVGFASVFALVLVLGGWGSLVHIAGAVVAQGSVQVDINQQVVQHPDGGVVAEILARDGDTVGAGDIVVRLDGRREQSDLTILENQILELYSRQARVEAEQAETEPDFGNLLSFAAETGRAVEAAELERGQRRLYQARSETFAREIEQLGEQTFQIGNQIDGLASQRLGLERQQELIALEVAAALDLLSRGLMPEPRVLALQREAARLEGEIGRLIAVEAQLRGQIASIEIEVLRLASSRREEAIGLARDILHQLAELLERRSALLATLERLEIRSPVGGVVHGSTLFTNRAVLQPSAPVMFIVPENAQLNVRVRIDATQVDRVATGQIVTLRFSSFDARNTPEILGEVARVSPDVFTDEVTGLSYYLAEVVLPEEQRTRLGDNELLPGMPVEALIQTDFRTPISYLVKPFSDYFTRALRER